MYLEHVNLVVSDLEEMLHFYRAAFPHWKVRSKGQGEWYGKARTWLHFGDDYHYIALSDHGEGQNRALEGHQVGLAHFAYVVQSVERVVNRLTEAGYTVDKVGAQHPYRKNVYFIDPAGYEIEFVEYMSDLPSERNSD
ncbi:VOC family protein [Pseudoalteromonas sp. Isolate6]|uniref:VOC family protein n=1 Tax=Pseudoalteromonas sp. Isolate6 TaxID=2908527 RepID=UPI001EFC595F|nr:VOC family protein [Pseudoalteromonas sp. Isolate6]MCG9759808.1 VOC family protein [Pseudoalteromonas sp. Isolate6]